MDPGSELLDRLPRWLVRWGASAWLAIGILLVAAVVYLGLAQISTLVAPLVVAVVIGMLFHPLVDRLQRLGVARALGAAVVLLTLVLAVTLALSLAVRGVVNQAGTIAEELGRGWRQLLDALDGFGVDLGSLENTLGSLGSNAGSGLSGILTATVSGVGLLLAGLLIGIFLLYYLLKDWHDVTCWLASHSALPQDLAEGLITDTTTAIRRYFYAITITSVPVAILIGTVMWVLGLPLAFTVVLVTFVTSYIPYIGAIVAGTFAVLVALGSGGLVPAAIVLLVVLVTQNVLQTVLLTRMSSTQLSLHPIVTFGSTIVGATLAGFLGATLSAPAVASLIAAQRRIANYRWGRAVEAADDQEPEASNPERR